MKERAPDWELVTVPVDMNHSVDVIVFHCLVLNPRKYQSQSRKLTEILLSPLCL